MAALNVRGRFVYMPGPWGMARPAAGLSFKIIDHDVGNANDVIFNGTTDANGEFSGLTSDWRDTRSVTVDTPVGSYSTNVSDVSDVMALRAEARQQIGARSYAASLPYVPPPFGLPAPPLVLPWAPSGRTQIRFDGAVKRTLNECVLALQGIFGVGASVASYTVNREIILMGDGVDALRQELNEMRSAIDALVATIRARLAAEQAAAAASASRQGAVARNVGANLALAADRAKTIARQITGQASGATQSASNPWEAIRQQILGLTQTLEQVAQRVLARCGATGPQLRMMTACAIMIVQALVSAVGAALIAGLVAGNAAPLAVAAIVSAVATIMLNIPALMNAFAAVLDLVGATDAATLLRGASGDFSVWMDSNSWFGSFLMLVLIACAIFVLLVMAPIDGWTWIVEQVNGADGVAGLRFVFSR